MSDTENEEKDIRITMEADDCLNYFGSEIVNIVVDLAMLYAQGRLSQDKQSFTLVEGVDVERATKAILDSANRILNAARSRVKG